MIPEDFGAGGVGCLGRCHFPVNLRPNRPDKLLVLVGPVHIRVLPVAFLFCCRPGEPKDFEKTCIGGSGPVRGGLWGGGHSFIPSFGWWGQAAPEAAWSFVSFP